MSSKIIPVSIPDELAKYLAQASKRLGLPQSQCIRLSIVHGLPEVLSRLDTSVSIKKNKQQQN